jgi:hypothetical protein
MECKKIIKFKKSYPEKNSSQPKPNHQTRSPNDEIIIDKYKGNH